MTIFQWITIPLLVVFSAQGFWKAGVRRQGRAAGFTTGILALSAAICIFQPELPATTARRLGIGRGADFVLYISCLVLLGVILYGWARLQRLEAALTLVVRDAALRTAQQDYQLRQISPVVSDGPGISAESPARAPARFPMFGRRDRPIISARSTQARGGP
jgi:hypothetical protein